jgi:hypothetical protein
MVAPHSASYAEAAGHPHKLGAIPKAPPVSAPQFGPNFSFRISISFKNKLLTIDNILAIKLLITNVHSPLTVA